MWLYSLSRSRTAGHGALKHLENDSQKMVYVSLWLGESKVPLGQVLEEVGAALRSQVNGSTQQHLSDHH